MDGCREEAREWMESNRPRMPSESVTLWERVLHSSDMDPPQVKNPLSTSCRAKIRKTQKSIRGRVFCFHRNQYDWEVFPHLYVFPCEADVAGSPASQLSDGTRAAGGSDRRRGLCRRPDSRRGASLLHRAVPASRLTHVRRHLSLSLHADVGSRHSDQGRQVRNKHF